MFSESADLYDLIYSGFKDYAAEAETLAAILRRVHPSTRTVLDVACGTGEHARCLADRYGYHVDGVDLARTPGNRSLEDHGLCRLYSAQTASHRSCVSPRGSVAERVHACASRSSVDGSFMFPVVSSSRRVARNAESARRRAAEPATMPIVIVSNL